MPTVAPEDAPADLVETLTSRVAELERTQQQEDVDGFLALFDDDAVWVTGGGRRLVGRPVIAEFTRSVLPGAMAGGSVTYVVDHVLVVRDDVVLTGVNQQYVDNAGHPTGAGLPTYVWRRREGSWLIVAGQNTGVPAED
ncbi:MAG TPA: SgcJ/EcaC family oxidoreductase [Acidimicrobiales bacterium]|nr:SgcJ/EcaC family oxidoreductase [Acidimicrobiales bacterium]